MDSKRARPPAWELPEAASFRLPGNGRGGVGALVVQAGGCVNGRRLKLERQQNAHDLLSVAGLLHVGKLVTATAPRAADGAEFRDLAKTVTAFGTLDSLLRDMRERYPEIGTLSPGETHCRCKVTRDCIRVRCLRDR